MRLSSTVAKSRTICTRVATTPTTSQDTSDKLQREQSHRMRQIICRTVSLDRKSKNNALRHLRASHHMTAENNLQRRLRRPPESILNLVMVRGKVGERRWQGQPVPGC